MQNKQTNSEENKKTKKYSTSDLITIYVNKTVINFLMKFLKTNHMQTH